MSTGKVIIEQRGRVFVMDILGYSIALLVAAGIAVGGRWMIDRQVTADRWMLSLFVLGFLGTYGGSELFGEIGGIESLSETGPEFGGFYILTGIVGGLVMAAATVLGQRRAVERHATDVASAGIRDPKIAHFLFSDSRAAALWLGVRLFVGYQWFSSGWGKVTESAWMDGGTALQSYWERIVVVPAEGRPAITYGWFHDFIQYMLDNGWYTWFAKLVAVGEVLIGAALILGVAVGIAAFFGTVMNFNFMLAGAASTNPVMFGLGIFLVLAWKVAGYWGLDRYLLPALGAPWSPGTVFKPGSRQTDTLAA